MASFWSTYLQDKILDHYRGVTTFTAPATTYFALMSAAPTVVGGGTETTAISRLSVTNSGSSWNAASSGSTTNKNELTFTSSSPGDLGDIVGIAEYDASSAGNLLTYGDLSTPKTLMTGMSFAVAAESGTFTFIDNTTP